MRLRFALPWICVLAASCRGTAPKAEGTPGQGISAVLLGARAILPSGESRAGTITVNLEGEAGRQSELDYRLVVEMKRPSLFEVEPGTYRLTPARSLFGSHQPDVGVVLEGAKYRPAFPKDILRRPPLTVKTGKVAVIGVLETRLASGGIGGPPSVKVRLDDTLAARRDLVQRMIKDMMDPSIAFAEREQAIQWSEALQNAMVELETEIERTPLYKPSP